MAVGVLYLQYKGYIYTQYVNMYMYDSLWRNETNIQLNSRILRFCMLTPAWTSRINFSQSLTALASRSSVLSRPDASSRRSDDQLGRDNWNSFLLY